MVALEVVVALEMVVINYCGNMEGKGFGGGALKKISLTTPFTLAMNVTNSLLFISELYCKSMKK